MIDLNVVQGSESWHAARAKCFCASEANAMMGVSSYMTRSELLRQKATGIVPEVDAATQARFDMGHMVEALARPLVEAIIGEELYPIVATDDSGKYLASSDGATMLVNIGFEHKAWNEKLASIVSDRNVPESHRWQLDHQFLVFGFEKILFVVSDGTPEKMVHCWYYPQPERIASLIAGWDQFEKDCSAWVPEETKPAAIAEVIEDLPALTVQLVGHVTASNLADYKTAVTARIQAINTTLVTDNDFATADKMVKFLDDGEKRLDLVKSQALSQTASIDELFRTIDSLKAEMRSKRLTLDRLVTTEKENRKNEIVREANAEFATHIQSLDARIGMRLPMSSPVFAEAIKGLRSLNSMRDKISVALANAKIEANAIADLISANRRQLIKTDSMSLFPDFAQVCTKSPEDFDNLLSVRVDQRKAADEKRLEAERERIRDEEQYIANKRVMEAVDAERATRREAEALAAIPKVDPDHFGDGKKIGESKTIKLGEICTRLGFTVTADFLASLGISPVATDKNAKLYDATKFPTICRLIQEHIGLVMRESFDIRKAA